MQKQSLPKTELTLVLRLLDQERAIAFVKVSTTNDFYVWSPQEWRSERSGHTSYHKSGERHLSAYGVTLSETVVKLDPPADVRGIGKFARFICLYSQFVEFPAGAISPSGRVILLDADAAGFRDDCFMYNLFLVEPGREDLIPPPSDVGPRVLMVLREMNPWLAVDVFQQALD